MMVGIGKPRHLTTGKPRHLTTKGEIRMPKTMTLAAR